MTASDLMPPGLDSQALATISVGDFFRQINWHGTTALASEGNLDADKPYETVGQFFATFPWQGKTPAMPSGTQDVLEDNDIIPIDHDTLTLEDLSALF